MSIEPNKFIPFDDAATHTYQQVCKKIEQFYGVDNADVYYQAIRKSILDKCIPDHNGISQYETLLAYCEAKQLEYRYLENAA